MKTLIELYDERPLENVLSTEVFRPERTVYICPGRVAESEKTRKKLKDYFRHRGVECELSFLAANMFSAESVLKQLKYASTRWEDCALDITGGTDAALFAGGLLCAERDIPVFTYSRRKNSFFPIRGAAFAGSKPCEVQYSVEDCFIMAGGSMRRGRVDNAILSRYLGVIDPMFELYMAHRRNWNRIVNYMQRASYIPRESRPALRVSCAYVLKGERGQRIEADESALRDMERVGLIHGLSVDREDGVSFTFADEQIRAWLRDVGSVLELYVYKACIDTGLFQDVRTSAVVDWEGDNRQGNVTNEIDVMACRGVTPLFISCKTCDVRTEALNELAILRGRFGGGIARAAIVTAENGSAIMRRRAAELDINVIDLKDLRAGTIKDHIRALLR